MRGSAAVGPRVFCSNLSEAKFGGILLDGSIDTARLDEAERSELLRLLQERRSTIVENWHGAIANTSFTPFTVAEMHRRLDDLTGTAIELLLSESFERHKAREIGSALADMHYLSSEALGGTQEILAKQLLKDVPPDKVVVLQSRLAALLGEIGAGFFGQARETILREQERIKAALLSERRQAEEALRRSEASLAEAQRIAHVGHWDFDWERDTLYWSEEIYRIFGVTEEEFGGTFEDFFRLVHPEDMELLQRAGGAALTGGTILTEHRIVRPGGEIRTVQQRLQFIFDEGRGAAQANTDGLNEETSEAKGYLNFILSMASQRTGEIIGRPVRVVGTVQDITERRHVQEELEKRATQLESYNAELERFAFSVSHDLRAPLRWISGFSGILLDDYADSLDDKGKDYLSRILAASESMGERVDSLLEVSRLTRRKLHRETINLSSTVEGIVEDLQKSHPERETEFIITKGLSANVDDQLMRIAVENLLDNAWKFTRYQSHPRIEFGAVEENGETVYFVKDNGVGFDEAYAENLFGPFQRLHTSEEFEGTGLGLSTVQRIIHRHGGRVWAEGEMGRGAAFYFTL